jgi:hypothetical protein
MVTPINGGNAHFPIPPAPPTPAATPSSTSSLRGRVGYAAAALLSTGLIVAAVAMPMPMPTGTHAYAAPSGPPITAVVGGCASSSGLYDQDNVRYRVWNDGIGEQAGADVYDEHSMPGRGERAGVPLMAVNGDVLTGSILFALPHAEAGKVQNTLEVRAVGDRLQVSQRDAGFQVRGDAHVLTIEGNGVQSTVVLGDNGADRMDVYLNQKPSPPKYRAGESVMEVPTNGVGQAVIHVANPHYDGGFYDMTSGCEVPSGPILCIGDDSMVANGVAYRVSNYADGDLAQVDVYGGQLMAGAPPLSISASVPKGTVYFNLPPTVGNPSPHPASPGRQTPMTPGAQLSVKAVGGELRVDNPGEGFEVSAAGDNRLVTIQAGGVQSTVVLTDGDEALRIYTNQLEIGDLVPGEARVTVPTDRTGPAQIQVATGKPGATDDALLASGCA